MKKIFLVLIIFAVSITFAQAKVKWYSFNDGVKLAKKQNKHILVDFYADWCHWCKVMDDKTFSNKKVAAFLKKNYICIRVDTEDKKRNISYRKVDYTPKEFFSAVGGTGLPTLLFLNNKADIITKIPGYVEKDVFLPISKYISQKCYLRSVSFKDYKAGKADCSKKTKKKK